MSISRAKGLTDRVFITEVESVYCAVRTESLCKTDKVSPLNGSANSYI